MEKAKVLAGETAEVGVRQCRGGPLQQDKATAPGDLLNCRISGRPWFAKLAYDSSVVRKEAEMLKNASTLLVVSLVVTCALAKDKTKSTLPPYVLHAQTVAVIIDPSAGMSIGDPRANEMARKDVEAALLKWGRFEPVLGTQAADLVIVVRKGNGRLMDETIPDPRQNNRPGDINSTDNGVSMGGQRGPQPGLSGEPGPGSNQGSPRPQTEVGQADDSFAVFKGGERPLDAPPAWRYMAKYGLSSPDVPAVAAFRKAVTDADKAAAKQP